MASNDLSNGTDENSTTITDTTFTRRQTLGLLGTALAASAPTVGIAGASSHDALVYEGGSGTYVAENGGTVVYSGSDLIDAVQGGVDSLTGGRTTKEKVRVDAAGYTGSHSWDGDLKAVDLPSYTILDVPGSIDVNDSGDPLIVPVRAQSVSNIEIQRLNVTGNPRYGMLVQSCSNVVIDNVNMNLSSGLGIRIDDGDGGRTDGVTLNYANVSGAGTHAVETYGVDNVDIGTVEATDIATGCGLLLNDTAYATVDYVNALRCDQGGGYAGFRCANYAGPEIVVNRVDAVDCGRGIFTVSGSEGIEIFDIYADGCGTGALIQDTRWLNLDGGTITNNEGDGVRIDSRSSNEHPHTRVVTVQNLQIDNNNYGVLETGPDTENNYIQNNHFCNNATADIQTYASNTEVSGNTYC